MSKTKIDDKTGQATITNGWKNPPSVAQLKEDLTNVITYQGTNVANIDHWLDLLNITGKVKIKKRKGRSGVQPKLIRKQIEWRIPTLTDPFLSTDDIFNVTGKTYEDVYAATQNQLVLNYQFNTVINKVPFIDSYVRTFTTEGTVFLRIGWKFEEEEQTVLKPQYDYTEPSQEDIFILQQAMQLQQSDQGKYIALVPENVKHSLETSAMLGRPVFATRLEEDEEVKEVVTTANHPTIEIVDYRRIYIDPNCGDNLDEAEFVVYSFDTSMDELNRDGNYKNLENIKYESVDVTSLTDAQIEDGVDFNFQDDTRKRITAYEYWGNWDIDNSGQTTAIVATWIGDTLIRLEENPYPDKKHPFVNATYIPKKNSVYGETDAELLEDNQAIYGATMRSMIDILARTANGQKGMRQDMLDAVNKIRYQNGDDYEFNPSVDPRQGIVDHKSPEVPQSAQYMLQMQNQEAEALSGIKAYSQGIGSEALGDVAAGIKGALDATSKRDLSILRRLSYGLQKAARKIIALNAEFLSEEEVIRVTEDEYVPVRKDDLKGNFDLTLSISTAEEDNNKANQMAFMLQTIGNSVPFDITKLVLADIAKLRKMPDLAKKLEDYQQQPDPLEQQKQQLEIALLQAQIQSEQALAMQRQADARLDMSKTGNTEADTNQKALDFVEQESGVTQERQLQKDQAQAQGNMKLEMLKAALNKTTNENPSERVESQDKGE